MPLTKRQVDVPLSSGASEKSDVRSVDLTGAISLVNCVHLKNGAIRKRFGNVGLSNTINRPPALAAQTPAISYSAYNAVRGGALGNAGLLFDKQALSRYSETAGAWELADVVPECVALNRIPISGLPVNFGSGYDCDANASYVVMTYLTSQASLSNTSVVTCIVDNAGNIVQPPTVVYVGLNNVFTWSKVIVVVNKAILAWVENDGVNTHIYLSSLDLTNIQAGWSAKVSYTTTNLLNGITPSFDMVSVDGDNTRFDLAYVINAGGGLIDVVIDEVAVSNFAQLRHTPMSVARPAADTISYISLKAISGENHWVVFADAIGGGPAWTIFAGGYTDVGHVVIGPTSMQGIPSGGTASGGLGIERVDATHAVIVASYALATASGPSPATVIGTYTNYVTQMQAGVMGTNGVINGVRKFTYHAVLNSRLKYVTGPDGVARIYFLAAYPSGLQGTQFLMCWDAIADTSTTAASPARIVATLEPRLSKMAMLQLGTFTSTCVVTPRLVPMSGVAGGTVLATLTNAITAVRANAIALQPFDFNSQLRYFNGALSNASLGISGGVPGFFDGQTYSEFSFPYYPELYTVSGAGTGHSYSYVFTYEYIDATGQISRSAPSPPIATTGTGGTFTFQTSAYGWRSRTYTNVNGNLIFPPSQANISVVVWRTTDAGTIYYRCANTSLGSPISSDGAAMTGSWTDAVTDSDLIKNDILYTQGGSLPSLTPPSARVLITHKQRYWLAGCDEPSVLWASKAFVSGEVPAFNESQNLVTASAVTALASLDDKLIVFHASGIEYITGEGPADNGTQNDWTINPIPSDVGAVDQRSIVVMPQGVTFKSNVGGPTGSGGLFLLTRDLQVHYLSAQIEDSLSSLPVVTSATLHPNAGRVYFTLAANDNPADVDSSVRVVWDYITSTWSTDALYGFDASNSLQVVRTSWVARGTPLNGTSLAPLLWWATPAGRVYRETTGVGNNSYVDQSAAGAKNWITSVFKSAWIKPSMSGFARFWRVQVQGDVLDSASIAVALTFDYASSAWHAENFSWLSTAIATFDRYPQCDFQCTPLNQKAKAIQITLTDASPVGNSYTTGQGFSWASVSFELGVDDKSYANLPSGQRG